MASTNEICSCSMRKFTAFPPLPHPKHLKIPLCGATVNDGVFSLWNGQLPMKFIPLFLRLTNSEITSVIWLCAVSIIRSTVAGSIIVYFCFFYFKIWTFVHHLLYIPLKASLPFPLLSFLPLFSLAELAAPAHLFLKPGG